MGVSPTVELRRGFTSSPIFIQALLVIPNPPRFGIPFGLCVKAAETYKVERYAKRTPPW
jgi:hypothetical protein